MSWLIAEDEADIRQLVTFLFNMWGRDPLVFPDGHSTWRWLDEVEQGTVSDLPELALMDIRMPGHTGDELAARIRSIEALKHIPVVLMTAFTLTDEEIDALIERTGISQVIAKPLPSMDDLHHILSRIKQ
jgi:CheY-like chemotaxis protein